MTFQTSSKDNGEGDVEGLVERLNGLKRPGHCGESTSAAIGRYRYNLVLEDAASAISKLKGERDELSRQVFVPGVRRCAKCSLRLVTSTLNAHSGGITANNDPQDCPNGCGPMWPITEREAGNDLCDRLDNSEARAQAAEQEIGELREGLRPFANFAQDNTERDVSSDGGQYFGIWAGNRCERERICDWFGPSDFFKARALVSRGGS